MAKANARRRRRGEFSLIAGIAQELARAPSRRVEVGIGDDAAIVRVGTRRLAVSVDDQVEGVHFDLRWLDLADVGYRALQAAASDLAAMGAKPLAAVASLHVPSGVPEADLRRLARGQAQAALQLGCPVVGGNITRGDRLSVTTTVLGDVTKPLVRHSARAGDELWVLGELGLARAGLLLHQQRLRVPAALRGVAARARAAWARPEARIADGQKLRGRARAAIDVSDGLSGDVRHLADASGVKAVIEAERLARLIPDDLASLADLLGEAPVALALIGGEDYALLAAGPRARRPREARVIGKLEGGRGAELELETGRRLTLAAGFDHLRD
jgi:thiamine-monophosphate kinase